MKVALKYLCLLMTCVVVASATTTTISSATTEAKIPTDCNITCGNVEVPYPFGIDDPKCAKDISFVLNCSRSYSPPQLFVGLNVQVVNISLEEATMSVVIHNVAYACYDESGVSESSVQSISIGANTPYTFSNTENKFIGLGCDTIAYMAGDGSKFGSGCISLCSENVSLANEGSCSGFGCCQTSVPKNVKKLQITLGSTANHSGIMEFNPCDFAFLVDQRSFDVSKMRLDFTPQTFENSSLLLDWVVDNKTCEEAKLNINGSTYACGENTNCSYSDNALGYRCHCLEGFRGNPYDLQQGCQDINECEEPGKHPCEGKCKNKIGDYECKCPLGMHGDGKVGCQGFRVTAIASVIGAIIFVAIVALFIFYDCKRRKREKLFRENGGLVLKHQRVRIFSKADLAKATNNYAESLLLGRGGFASVYRGSILIDERSISVAVKKPKEDDKIQINSQQFHEEIA
ncbi:hypothetical protein TIFTF001_044401, partial [Ficus carica]